MPGRRVAGAGGFRVAGQAGTAEPSAFLASAWPTPSISTLISSSDVSPDLADIDTQTCRRGSRHSGRRPRSALSADAGRKSGASLPARSCASTIFSRSLAITALFRRAGKSRSSRRIISSPEQSAEEAPALRLHKAHLALLAEKTGNRVEIGPTGRALLVEGDRRTGIRRAQHRFRFRDDAEQRDRQDFLDVLDRQHLALCDPRGS